jgi:HSP20 family protein
MSEQTVEMELEKQEMEIPEGMERTHNRRVYIPRVDIYESGDNVILLADMPGVASDGVDITLEKNELTLKGYVQHDLPESHDLAYAEYGVGDYERSFVLSDEVDRERIEATMKHGVLRLVLPKAETAKLRKIAVKAG